MASTSRRRCRPARPGDAPVWADTMGLCGRCVRDAIEVLGIDHIVLGTDYGPVPISPREHIDMVLALGLSSEEEDKILWRTRSCGATPTGC
jgi:predicted TIM-barrel fold metal-dependent hydrolase